MNVFLQGSTQERADQNNRGRSEIQKLLSNAMAGFVPFLPCAQRNQGKKEKQVIRKESSL